MKELATALATAQGEIKNATLNKVNPHFKSKYADLAEIRDCTVPILARHGLAVVQITDIRDGQVCLITRLLHKSGEHIDSVYPLNADPLKPQAMGSAMTYARRYCLAALCAISAEEDDDGNAAEKHPRKAVKAPNEQPKAASRPVFDALQKQVQGFSNLDSLDAWWQQTSHDSSLPRDWLKLLFIQFITHGLKIAPSQADASAFKQAYAKALNALTDDERQGIEDAVDTAAGNAG
jgi:hypothetical protein